MQERMLGLLVLRENAFWREKESKLLLFLLICISLVLPILLPSDLLNALLPICLKILGKSYALHTSENRSMKRISEAIQKVYSSERPKK